MALRSTIVKTVHDYLFAASEHGYGISLIRLQNLCGNRDIFGVIWEMRRHGAETIAVRKGREIVGWILKTRFPDNPIPRATAPSDQVYVEYRPGLFGPSVRSPVLGRTNAKSLPYNPSLRPMTKAAKRILAVAATH